MKNRIYYCISMLLIVPNIFGQGFYLESGASLFIENGSTLYSDRNIQLESNSAIDNNGSVQFEGNWINNSGNTGLINNSQGRVNMTGGNQLISGSSVTEFYTLNLLGGFTLKELKQDAVVTNELSINDSELNVHQKSMYVTNPSLASVQWSNGFISGDSIGGYFYRSTNQTGVYRYPVGSGVLSSSVYRGVDLAPTTGDSSVFGVRLAAVDASFDNTGTSLTGAVGPYDLSQKHGGLYELNDQFYHHVTRAHGNSKATVKLYYFDMDHPGVDRKFDGLGQWNSVVPRWENVGVSHSENVSGPIDLGSPTNFVEWTTGNFTDDAFSLGVLDLTPLFVPQIFSPNGDGLNDLFYVRSNRIEKLTFIVYNRWGQKVFETQDPTVGWDGTLRGSPAQSGVYVYYIGAEVKDLGPVIKKGNITLVR